MLIEFEPFGGGGSSPTPRPFWDYYKLKYRKPIKCTLDEFNDTLHDMHTRRVRSKYIGGYWISTVFLGMDHNYFSSGPPLLFETMIFSDDIKDSDLDYCERCSTWREALHQHRTAIDYLKLLISQQNKD